MSGPPQLNNRRDRRNVAQTLAKEFMQAGTRKRSLWRLAWSWPVVGAVLLFVWGGSIAFMTSSHAIIGDIFFIAGSALFIVKFLSWEDARKHDRRVTITTLTVSAVVFLTLGSIWGNHRMNAAAGEGVDPGEGFIQFSQFAPRFTTPLTAAQPLSFNIYSTNKGQGSVKKFLSFSTMYLTGGLAGPQSEWKDKDALADFRKRRDAYLDEMAKKHNEGVEVGSGDSRFGTVEVNINDAQGKSIEEGKTKVYLLGWARWTTLKGHSADTLVCYWVQWPSAATGPMLLQSCEM
jgi:hypothetical protein